MLCLEKDEHNLYHAYLDFDKSNAIVTSKHCFENRNFNFSKIRF